MKLTPQEQETLDAYEQNAKAWASSRNDPEYWQKEKTLFKEYLPEGKILEVGAGGGRDAKDLISSGYSYIGTDISEELLKEARINVPEAHFEIQSVYELDFKEETFDGVWACAVLLHMPKARIDEALMSIRRVMKTGGIMCITLKKGADERFVIGDHKGIDYKRFFSFYEEDEFTSILERNKFEVLKSYVTDHSNKKWLVFFVKKTPSE